MNHLGKIIELWGKIVAGATILAFLGILTFVAIGMTAGVALNQ